MKADVSDEAQVRRLVDETRARFGPVSILVNNAGVAIKKPFEELTESDWDAARVHAPDESGKSVSLLTQAALSGNPDLIDAVVKNRHPVWAANAAGALSGKTQGRFLAAGWSAVF